MYFSDRSGSRTPPKGFRSNTERHIDSRMGSKTPLGFLRAQGSNNKERRQSKRRWHANKSYYIDEGGLSCFASGRIGVAA